MNLRLARWLLRPRKGWLIISVIATLCLLSLALVMTFDPGIANPVTETMALWMVVQLSWATAAGFAQRAVGRASDNGQLL